jgi:hypothetical protein
VRSGTSLLTTGNKMLFSHCSNINIYKGIASRTIFHLIIKLQEGTDSTLIQLLWYKIFSGVLVNVYFCYPHHLYMKTLWLQKVCKSVCGQHCNYFILGLLVTGKTVVLMQQKPTKLTTQNMNLVNNVFNWTQSWTNNPVPASWPISLRSILILFSNLLLGLESNHL